MITDKELRIKSSVEAEIADTVFGRSSLALTVLV
jgi:hypothetical protein